MAKRQWSTKHYSEHWCLQTFSEEGQTMQWPKDNDLQNTPIVFWPLHCLSFFTKSLKTPVFWGVFRRSLSFGHCMDRQCNGQKTMITKHYSEHWCLQTVREDGQTMQWPKENDLQNTSQNTDVFKLLVKDIQCNVQKTIVWRHQCSE
jgi:hypothetical protein